MRAARDPLDATAARQAEGLPLRGVLHPHADEPSPTRIVPAHRLLDLRPPSHLAQESEEDMAEVVERRGPRGGSARRPPRGIHRSQARRVLSCTNLRTTLDTSTNRKAVRPTTIVWTQSNGSSPPRVSNTGSRNGI